MTRRGSMCPEMPRVCLKDIGMHSQSIVKKKAKDFRYEHVQRQRRGRRGTSGMNMDTNACIQSASCQFLPFFSCQARPSLDSNPGDGNNGIHALLLGPRPLVAVCAVLLVVPVGADCTVHASAAVLLWF